MTNHCCCNVFFLTLHSCVLLYDLSVVGVLTKHFNTFISLFNFNFNETNYNVILYYAYGGTICQAWYSPWPSGPEKHSSISGDGHDWFNDEGSPIDGMLFVGTSMTVIAFTWVAAWWCMMSQWPLAFDLYTYSTIGPVYGVAHRVTNSVSNKLVRKSCATTKVQSMWLKKYCNMHDKRLC